MYKKYLLTIFLLSFYSGLCQTEMTEHILRDIKFYTINQKEKNTLIKEFDGLFKEDLSDKKYSSKVYMLNDNRVIFDMVDMKIFLFSSLSDMERFKAITSEIAVENVKSQIEIKDDDFISKVYLYITFFKDSFSIDIDFNNVEDLKKIDTLIDKKEYDIIIKYKNSLVAIAGEFIRLNVKNGEWKYLVDNTNPINPVIDCHKGLFEPIYIIEEVIYNEKSLYNYVNDLLNNYYRGI